VSALDTLLSKDETTLPGNPLSTAPRNRVSTEPHLALKAGVRPPVGCELLTQQASFKEIQAAKFVAI
jgi:hypothetical protein